MLFVSVSIVLEIFFIVYLPSSAVFHIFLNEVTLPVHQKEFQVNQEAGRDAVRLPYNLAICRFTPPPNLIRNVIKTKGGYCIGYPVLGIPNSYILPLNVSAHLP